MKVLVGVDREGKYAAASRLVSRLGFENAEWHFAHVRKALYGYSQLDLAEGAAGEDVAEGRQLLQQASAEHPGQIHLLRGPEASTLLHFSDEIAADLVAVGSHPAGRLGSVVLGSVGRALAIGAHCSFLIARGQQEDTGPLRAIFATDHSDYADRCLDLLIQLAPKGLSEVVVMTATDMFESAEMMEYYEHRQEADQEGVSMEQHFRAKGQAAVDQLEQAGIPARFDLRPGFIGTAIRDCVGHCGADLVILGAQGQGFMERLLIGSVALDLVNTLPQSMLVLRAR